MENPERIRFVELRKKLTVKAEQARNVHAAWSKLDAEKRELDREVKVLVEELDALAQGQLVFPKVS